jgi:hypothetical protein
LYTDVGGHMHSSSRLSFTTRFRTGAKDKRHEEVLRIKWHEVVVLDWRR